MGVGRRNLGSGFARWLSSKGLTMAAIARGAMARHAR